MPSGLKFPKKERLCAMKVIDTLMDRRSEGTRRRIAYPLVAVWMPNGLEFNRAMFVVPKKRLRRAVMRVAMRRRMREAYRLNRSQAPLRGMDIAFIYVADGPLHYAAVERSVQRLLSRLSLTDDAPANV